MQKAYDSKNYELNLVSLPHIAKPFKSYDEIVTDINKDPVSESLNIITPAWPLQNTVAVNPFWFERKKHIIEAYADLELVLHQSLFMPLDFYRQKYRKGEITNKALQSALLSVRKRWLHLPSDIGVFREVTEASISSLRATKTASEALPSSNHLHQSIIQDLSKYCAAYFDDKQAIVAYPWQSGSFWSGWFEAQNHDKSMTFLGLKDFSKTVDCFRHQGPRGAINYILDELGLESQKSRYIYCQRLLATLMGWASQFKYIEWQKSLGYEIAKKSDLIEFLAIRMIYDFAVIEQYRPSHPSQVMDWSNHLSEVSTSLGEISYKHIIHYVWQLSFEFSMQHKVAIGLSTTKPRRTEKSPNVQMIFCIDVRSEMIRRHIEKHSSEVQTIGFAGFFGIPMSYQKIDEEQSGHRLPVLLPPGIQIKEELKSSVQAKDKSIANQWMLDSYFRNFRKASLSSFLYVELFGIMTVGKMIFKTAKTIVSRLKGQQAKSRFDDRSSKVSIQKTTNCQTHKHLSIGEQVNNAKSILTHLGMTKQFGKLVIFCGHGASTTNNPLNSALDCGACGGHAGDMNAKAAADLFNNKAVRLALRDHNIHIPAETFFVAAIHETVTDSIHLLDEERIPSRFESEIKRLKKQFLKAGEGCSSERNHARSDVLDHKAERRGANWSEVRPEWGLAGNTCFIVAPRSRTKGINLSSQSFLQDYDWQKDHEFKTLELIMTAPMIVTNWINLQYYASVVCPDYYSSGNKLLHNLTGENGVVEGNGGDLRTGLSIQSIFDGKQYTHQPVRLSVFIEAPQSAIEDIIGRHEVVRLLVENEWLHILNIEPNTKEVKRRIFDGTYESIPS